MRFVTLTTLVNQTLIVTGRYAGQAIRFDGVTATLPEDGASIRLRGSGDVEVGEGYWTKVLVSDITYSGPYFDGDSGEGELIRYRWVGEPGSSESVMEGRALVARPQTDEEYEPFVTPTRRFLRGVGTLSGAIVTREFRRDESYGYLVEFTLGSEDPWVYGSTKAVSVPPVLPYLIQDEAYNLVTAPSAELAGSPVVVATNYSLNPSVEVNGDYWGFSTLSTPGRATLSGTRTVDISAEGSWAWETRLLADGVGPTVNTLSAGVYLAHLVPMDTAPLGQFEVRLWGAIIVAAGQATVGQMNATVLWRDSTDAPISLSGLGGDVPAGSYGGYNFSGSVIRPANAASAVVRIWYQFEYTASADPALNADVRMYGDAVVFAIQ